MPLTPALSNCKDRTVDHGSIDKLDLEISALRSLNICSQLQPKKLAVEVTASHYFSVISEVSEHFVRRAGSNPKSRAHEYERGNAREYE